MSWDWLKNKLRGGRPSMPAAGDGADVRWLDAAASPWGVPVLDLRPFALSMLSTSKDAQQAANAMSFSQDDGAAFIGVAPRHAERHVPAHLRYAVETALVDGALFLPTQMEHKWAIFFRQEKIIFVRSWTREVAAVASLHLTEGGKQAEITGITGALMMADEESAFTVRAVDFLLRSHALGLDFPAPLPADLTVDLHVAAQWCFSLFGNRALFAACHPVHAPLPARPLRTYSVLHLAVARGEAYHVDAALARGFPVNLRDRDGLTPLHWAVTQPNTRIMELLLARGAQVDAPSDEGATTLMHAAQEGGLPHVICLLAHGADPRAADARGFTALHRAAEMGKLEIARILLERGASAEAAAPGGHTRFRWPKGGRKGPSRTCSATGAARNAFFTKKCSTEGMLRSTRLAAAALLASALTMPGQSTTGTILGAIKDSSGASVPQARVVATNTGTNAKYDAQVSAEGAYTAPLLPIGTYSLEVTAPGFRTYRQDGIRLSVNQQARVDVALAVGAVTETVEVTADADVVEATTSSVGKVVDNKRIRELPLNTRNVYALIYLTPGVAGGIGNSHNQIGYSINGVRGGLMDTLIDGATAAFPTVNGFHGISVFPSVDAVEEFKVQAQNYSAEFGRSLGSVLNLVYKSGTNQFHGSAYNFLRNSKLDANNWFNNRRGIGLGSFKRNQFGGVFSGPVKRDRTFFMTSFEALRQRSFGETLTTVPTALERRGDFSQTAAGVGRPIMIFDPLTTRANPAGAGSIRTPFPGNAIPNDRFDTVARNVVRWWPEANQAGVAGTNLQNYYNSGSARVNTDNFDVRIDHNITARQRIFGRYSRRRSFDGPPQLFAGELGIAEGRINLNDWGTNSVIDYTNTLTPSLVWTTRAGFARNKYLYENNGLGFLPSSLGLPRDIEATADRAMFPNFSVSGMRGLGGGDHRQSGFNSWSLLSNLARERQAFTQGRLRGPLAADQRVGGAQCGRV